MNLPDDNDKREITPQLTAAMVMSAFIILLIIAEILFFGVVITHISVSFTNGLVTLGILTSESVRNKMDTVIFMYTGRKRNDIYSGH